ncbi:unnamed protein product [Cuscuta campestris]|uniref:RNase H type-1 domain-containing protein n=1 Tax=Cuscuta campestris TaxID=132261 RepID=A0A484KA43_9ASTE|nr:unnamed protein product [Cuscuta campestris]
MLKNPSKALLDKGNDPPHKATRQLEDETSHLAPHQQHAPTRGNHAPTSSDGSYVVPDADAAAITFPAQLVSTMAPVNLTGALNAAGPSRPPRTTNPQITPDGHCVSIESDDGEWDIPRSHKKKKGKNIRPATSQNSAFERLGDREESQRKSAKQRLGQSVAHVSAFARLGEVREAEPARTRRSRSNRQEPTRTRASHEEGEAESQPRLPVANRLAILNDRVQQMEAKLERLEKKVGEKNDRDKPLAGSPFTTRVHLTPLPRKVKIDAPRFTGKEDPEIHLDSFNQSATMNGCTDEEKCLLFFQTLRNRATEWFNKLRPGSIDSFSDLASKFKAKSKKFKDIKCVHNAILGRPGINRVGAVISMPHLCMKFHTPGGVGEVKGDQRNARECYAQAVKKMTKGVNVISQEITKGETREKLEPNPEKIRAITEMQAPTSIRDVQKLTDLPVNKPTEQWWEMAVDGASGPRGYWGGIVFTTPEGFKIYHAIVFNFKLTNNEAEYEALAGGLRLAQALKISRVSIKSDSSLIVGQVTGNMEAREGRMAQYKDLVHALLRGFEEFKIAQIPRAENADADLLSKLSQYAPEHVSKLARAEILDRASIEKLEVAAITAGSQFDRSNLVGADDHWMYDLMEYLVDGSLPEKDDRARKVKLRAPRFQILDGKLYKRAFGGALLRCLTNREAERVIAEVHEGVCAAHQMSPRLPIEAEFPTFRESNYQPQQNEEDHLAELNLVEEQRMAAEVKMSTYQQVVKKYHDNKVGPRYFQVGDEVLRRREASRPGDGGKLAINWEGPYRVRAIIRPETYRLETLDGVPIERTWNSHHLRKFYK